MATVKKQMIEIGHRLMREEFIVISKVIGKVIHLRGPIKMVLILSIGLPLGIDTNGNRSGA